jgi:hypothetical protein
MMIFENFNNFVTASRTRERSQRHVWIVVTLFLVRVVWERFFVSVNELFLLFFWGLFTFFVIVWDWRSQRSGLLGWLKIGNARKLI